MRIALIGLLFCGCAGFPFFFGGQSAEANKSKSETAWNMGGNRYSGKITPMEAAQADAIRLRAAGEIEKLRSDYDKARMDLVAANSWGDKWKDRFIICGIIAALVLIFVPGAFGWLATKLKKSKDEAVKAYETLNEQHKKDLERGNFKE